MRHQFQSPLDKSAKSKCKVSSSHIQTRVDLTHLLLSNTVYSMVINHEESPGASRAGRPPVIFNPDFFVEKLRHENPDVFLELVLSNITRLIDLPGSEFAQLLGEDSPKTPTGGNGGFFRSFNFLKRKGQTLS